MFGIMQVYELPRILASFYAAKYGVWKNVRLTKNLLLKAQRTYLRLHAASAHATFFSARLPVSGWLVRKLSMKIFPRKNPNLPNG